MAELKSTTFTFPPRVKGLKIQGCEDLFPVGKIYCVGKNYEDHAKEMGGSVDRDQPFFFSKPPQAMTQAPSIPFPALTQDLHHEVELVVFLKSPCSNIEPKQASQHIFGYAVGVDLTKRDLQAIAKEDRKPWDLSKGFDNSAPISNILKNEEVVLKEGDISLSVNGQEKQASNITHMAWGVDEIISWLSKFISLHPGDIIFTGTPAGVGALKRGDHVDASIQSVGDLSFELV
ncbi:fumarylacetoacetate hydrolase family protein [Gammaproteobacteria bacterium]|nr:fumarylacetoacetate hydrolase family protein [Gammaproteobacteria bacterium]MDA9341239.1 fumarylacetoacetate hydrolase family protein [Gammaproteobacteria bacterium]MDA9365000.1 fumarylacetoacetate hydrolase family protein [Gammaproteobacteria bacterium]MDA9370845.1 fumarylacetoacetate hydrolase family protein [Gammaproteobacteria bacterium]MDA9973621.1 fumarylacetoacetate hydrolase family protein [Gammaproteobacteria bacterium]